ncbi:MAG: ATP-binding cassette domain-containing protein [Bacteroidetes bacterium]|nr:ATP-binding cassette domain-containing protein [Bacteroidota bacterium]
MSERILKALMQMFAIIAKADGANTGRIIVQSFLKQQLNQEMVEQYLKIYDQYLEEYHKVSQKKEGAAKRTSLGSVKILKICTQINAELEQRQKVVVLIRLLEFIYSNSDISDQEREFVSTVAESFNISDDEFKRIMDFVRSKLEAVPDSSYLLVVDNKDAKPNFNVKHIKSVHLEGQIRVLQIPSVGMYIMRYFGTDALYLNGQVLAQDKIYILTEGSSIRSPRVHPIYYSDVIGRFLADTSKSKISFVAEIEEYKFPTGKVGLRNVNIYEESGKLIGIMGGSGAGKSTLLNVLNGNESPSKGHILINGINIHTEKDKAEGIIGMIPQDDLLIEELTVFQNLFYNAKLCFDNLTDYEITDRVNAVLQDLGLYEARNLKVGSPLEKTISGGQRKRLNIALELIREPSVLFVDEPTSGLSSRDSENIMDLLKELARKGKLLFVVIHQPSSDIYKMFDKMIILDVGGYPIYYGNPVDAIIYFKRLINHVKSDESECLECGNVNPEQIFNIIETKVLDEYGNQTRNRKISPTEWNKHYVEEIEKELEKPKEETTSVPSTLSIPNKLMQFKVFVTRDVLSKLANRQYLAINFLEAPLLGFILAFMVKFYSTDVANKTGYIFRENENLISYLFMSVVVALFIGMMVSAEEIIKDRKILKREKFLNLSRGSYLFSKIIILFTLSAIQMAMFIGVGNTILDIKGMYFDYWFALFTTACFANVLGLNISSAFNSAITVYIIIPILLIPQLLLSGVIVKFEKLNPLITTQKNVPIAGEMMASRWAFEALAVNQYKNNKFEKQFYNYDKKMSVADFKKNYLISKLKSKTDKSLANYKDPKYKEEVTSDLQLLHHEILREMDATPKIKCEVIDKIEYGKFNDDVAAQANAYLDQVQSYYVKMYNAASEAKDEAIAKLGKTETDREKFLQLQNEYSNESLKDWVRNTNDVDRILESNGEIIQRADPVFLDPPANQFLRAHFYAPRKSIFGKYFETYWVNNCFVWIFFTLTLIIALYFDWLKKLLDGGENLFSKLGGKKGQD